MDRELKQISSKISKLYAEVQSYESPKSLAEALSSRAYDGLFYRTEGLLEDLEEKYSLITFPPEVPAETQRIFFALHDLVHG